MGSCCGADKEAVARAIGQDSPQAKLFGLVERLEGVLSSWPVLALAAISLAASFILRGHGCGVHGGGSMSFADPALFPLAVCGLPILKEALYALAFERKIRAALLISLAMVSCVAIGELFAAGEVAFIMALGQTLEGWTVRRAKKGLSKLVSIVPQMARYVVTCPKCLAKGERFRMVDIGDIEVGDGVRVLPGETIPVDGTITEGTTSVDQSAITGESLPVDKFPGDEVYSGTINRFGAITLRATKAGEDSSIQKMVRLVREAEKRKAPMQRTADKWAGILVPCSLAIALCTFAAVWMILGDIHTALLRGTTVMVVFCPCALALATPTCIMAAIGQAAKFGVIVKSGEALERMGSVKVACFDKTGTLTTGKLSVACVKAFGAKEDESGVLALASAAEAQSGHPLAQAIVAEAGRRGGAPSAQAEDFSLVPGRGVQALVEGRRIFCGNAAWLAQNGMTLEAKDEAAAESLRGEGKAVVLVGEKGAGALGLVALADTLRDDAKTMLAELGQTGLRAILLTGDHASTAAHVAAALGIGEARAELLPEGKADAIAKIQAGGEYVAMIGDGINDAPALKTASVGIAMGKIGSDIAVEAADIALVGEDLARIPYLKRLSSACIKLIKTNITISMCINAFAIALSVLGALTPVTGALVHNLGSVCVILNGALLYDRDFRKTRRAPRAASHAA